ncbi:MAG: sensor histidine kinase [Eubacterium sp.]|jgi:two-component system phosphate regulon sensor histidine kinase PhoR
MIKKIHRSILLVSLIVLLAAAGLIMGAMYPYFQNVEADELKSQTKLAAQGVELDGKAYLKHFDNAKVRITWISKSGKVLYDNQADPSTMGNHKNRVEVKEAMRTGYGESRRYSKTLTEQLFYSAQRLPDNTVVRLSASRHSAFSLLIGVIPAICFVILAAIILSLILASRLAKRIAAPLNDLDLDHPLDNEDEYEEIAPLLDRIYRQQIELGHQRDILDEKQTQIDTILEHAQEGMVLLTQNGRIVSINHEASEILQTGQNCTGHDILAYGREAALQGLLARAIQGETLEEKLALGEEVYQVNASPILEQENVVGIVILFFNITEREKNEQMRREFTANVSHELKTPLHAISGYAELLMNKMVKPDDVPEFSNKIYTETQRMVRLVEDIIRLSHLDEGVPDLTAENVDMFEISQQTVQELSAEADAAKVKMEVTGESTKVCGYPSLLHEIVRNLVENAIKYNHENGDVRVSVESKDSRCILKVADHGIGIAHEDLNRIFERFYRVDKSHSRASGGTGLGLSIVKHAVQIHRGTISVDSKVGEGTTITVSLPLAKREVKVLK